MPLRLAQILGEALGAFEPRRRPARPERLDAGGAEIVDDAGAERRLRPDHDEIDLLRLAERDHRRMVGEIERHELGIPGRCRHCPARSRASRPAGSRRSSRPAHARARRSRGAGCSLMRRRTAETWPAWCSMARSSRKDQLQGRRLEVTIDRSRSASSSTDAMTEVFLSYSRADRPVAEAIARELQQLGVDVWWDHDLLGGDDYRRRISDILTRVAGRDRDLVAPIGREPVGDQRSRRRPREQGAGAGHDRRPGAADRLSRAAHDRSGVVGAGRSAARPAAQGAGRAPRPRASPTADAGRVRARSRALRSRRRRPGISISRACCSISWARASPASWSICRWCSCSGRTGPAPWCCRPGRPTCSP